MNEWLTVIDFVAGADADGQQRQMQRVRAIRHRARMRRAHVLGELALECGDFRSLRQPS